MNVKVNLSESKGFEPVPSGAYKVSITKVEAKTTQAGENALNWTLTIQDGDFTGQNLFLFTMLEGKGAFKLRELLTAAGIDCSSEQFDFDPEGLLGLDLTILVSVGMAKTKAGEDKAVNQIDKISPPVKKSRK